MQLLSLVYSATKVLSARGCCRSPTITLRKSGVRVAVYCSVIGQLDPITELEIATPLFRRVVRSICSKRSTTATSRQHLRGRVHRRGQQLHQKKLHLTKIQIRFSFFSRDCFFTYRSIVCILKLLSSIQCTYDPMTCALFSRIKLRLKNSAHLHDPCGQIQSPNAKAFINVIAKYYINIADLKISYTITIYLLYVLMTNVAHVSYVEWVI